MGNTLKRLVYDGLNKQYDNNPPQKAIIRAEYELKEIGKTGFVPLIIKIKEIVEWSKEK